MAIGPMPAPMVPGALGELNADLTGQTLQQAWESQNMSDPYDVGFGIANWTGNKPAISGNTNSTIHDSSETDPVDAWHDYVDNEAGEVSDITGGIVDGSSVLSTAYSLMVENEITSPVKAVVPIAIPLQRAAVAIGQYLGISMNWNEMADDVKNKFIGAIEAVSGAIYGDTPERHLLKGWWNGQTAFIDKSVLESVANMMEQEGIGGQGGYEYDDDLTVDGRTVPGPLSFFDLGADTTVDVGSNIYEGTTYLKNGNANYGYATTFLPSVNRFLFAAKRSFSGRDLSISVKDSQGISKGGAAGSGTSSGYTYDSKKVYWHTLTVPDTLIDKIFFNVRNCENVTSSEEMKRLAWYMIYGTGWNTGGSYPEGTEESEAPHYSASDLPIAGGIALSDDETTPVVAVRLPDDPENTIGSDTDPASPTPDDNIDTLPPTPIPLPIPDTRPSNPEIPLTNPTIIDQELIDTLVEELANTLDPQPGQSSGIIPVPALPGIGDPPTFPSIIPASGPGFIHVYNPTPAEFVAFGSWLWVTYADATIDKILNNPFDGVIGAHELYATPNTGGTDNIRSAFLTCPTTAALVPNRYSEIDCGTVIIPEFYGNYLDYSPYSQAYIYLPFIGINEVSIDDIVGHAVNIRYRVDSYSGSCIAMIFVAKNGYQNLCYQFAGSCSVEVPMAGGSQAAIKAGEMQAEAYARAGIANAALNGAAAIGSGLATGGLAGGLLGGLSALGGVAGAWYSGQRSIDAARIANKSSVQHSGQFGASHGAMGKKEPFIIIRNPIQVKVTNYNEDYGYPAHKRVIIGGCTGYLRVKEVNVISANATDEEKMAIEALLKNGVYVS